MQDREAPEPVGTGTEAAADVEQDAAEQRLEAFAPVDTQRLDTAQRSIDEARAAAERLRREQREDDDGEAAG